MNRKKEDMSKETFNQALSLINRDILWKNFNNSVVELHSFGEALLLGDKLFYYLDRMKEEEIPWSLSTNGILFGDVKFDTKLLSYDGFLEISVENINLKITLDEKHKKINNFLKLHKELNSNLIIYIISYGNVDYNKLEGNYIKLYYNLHTWSENDVPYNTCKFLNDDFFTIQSNGNIVSCCVDAEGETNFGTVFNPTFKHNKRWRKCDTCLGGLKK